MTLIRAFVFGVLVLLGLMAAAIAYAALTGLSARPEPGVVESSVARVLRGFAVPPDVKARANPVPASPAALAEGMAHFADHCAICHDNDGSGNTQMGRGLFPRPPDMRGADTQQLTDGELFYIIENGVRFTGMPAFATGDAAGEEQTWKLVRFIRRLPDLTPEEIDVMEGMNPRPPAEIRQEIEEERFLQGGDVSPAP